MDSVATNSSRELLILYISITSSFVILLTTTPSLGTYFTNPSFSNCLRDSLTGVLLILSLSEYSFSINRSPAGTLCSINVFFMLS